MSLNFDYRIEGGKIIIFRNGKKVSIIGGQQAQQFIISHNHMEQNEIQQKLARLTGNYKRGNERNGKNHPRNQKNDFEKM